MRKSIKDTWNRILRKDLFLSIMIEWPSEEKSGAIEAAKGNIRSAVSHVLGQRGWTVWEEDVELTGKIVFSIAIQAKRTAENEQKLSAIKERLLAIKSQLEKGEAGETRKEPAQPAQPLPSASGGRVLAVALNGRFSKRAEYDFLSAVMADLDSMVADVQAHLQRDWTIKIEKKLTGRTFEFHFTLTVPREGKHQEYLDSLKERFSQVCERGKKFFDEQNREGERAPAQLN